MQCERRMAIPDSNATTTLCVCAILCLDECEQVNMNYGLCVIVLQAAEWMEWHNNTWHAPEIAAVSARIILVSYKKICRAHALETCWHARRWISAAPPHLFRFICFDFRLFVWQLRIAMNNEPTTPCAHAVWQRVINKVQIAKLNSVMRWLMKWTHPVFSIEIKTVYILLSIVLSRMGADRLHVPMIISF